MNLWVRRQYRVINIAIGIFLVAVLASVASPMIENIVGVIVTVVLVLLVIRGLWPHTVGEWRKDRALVREVGAWDDPRTPILVIGLDGKESIIRPNDSGYPAALMQREHAIELARRSQER